MQKNNKSVEREFSVKLETRGKKIVSCEIDEKYKKVTFLAENGELRLFDFYHKTQEEALNPENVSIIPFSLQNKNSQKIFLKNWAGNLIIVSQQKFGKKKKNNSEQNFFFATVFNPFYRVFFAQQKIVVPSSYGELFAFLPLKMNYFSFCFNHAVVLFSFEMLNFKLSGLLNSHTLTKSYLGN